MGLLWKVPALKSKADAGHPESLDGPQSRAAHGKRLEGDGAARPVPSGGVAATGASWTRFPSGS